MPIEKIVKQKLYVKIRIGEYDDLKLLKEDAERIIAGCSATDGSKPLFSNGMLKIAKQLKKDCEQVLKSG